MIVPIGLVNLGDILKETEIILVSHVETLIFKNQKWQEHCTNITFLVCVKNFILQVRCDTTCVIHTTIEGMLKKSSRKDVL